MTALVIRRWPFSRQTLWDVFDTTETINLLAREVADFIDRIQYK